MWKCRFNEGQIALGWLSGEQVKEATTESRSLEDA